jgi:glyoxylase-like metal-dependent hydrolase (beta-lactamase superfamily II)
VNVRVGRYEVASVVDAFFSVDGGAMFGVVPRPAWERELAPDAHNRVRLAARCLVAVDRPGGRTVVVGAGLGDRWDGKAAARLALDRSGGGIDSGLARLGLARDDVTDVVLTHLHVDHAGGVARRGAGGGLELTFPRARHHVQRRAWQLAHAPSERDRGLFRAEDFDLLGRSNLLHLVDGDVAPLPDVELVASEGHTAGLQLPRFHGERSQLTFCGDLIPTRAHLRLSWVAAYDHLPVTTIEEKKVLLAEALEEDGVLAFEHDPALAACRLEEDQDGQPVFREAVEL